MPRHQRLWDEASQLVETEKKFDHPAHGTKDLTDAAAGAYLDAVNSEEAKSLSLSNVPALHWGTVKPLVPNPYEPPMTIDLPRPSDKPPRIIR